MVCLQLTTGQGNHSNDQQAVWKPLVQKSIQDDYPLTILNETNLGVVDVAVQGSIPPPPQEVRMGWCSQAWLHCCEVL